MSGDRKRGVNGAWPGWARWGSLCLLVLAVVHIGRGFREEALAPVPPLNDEVLHLALTRATDEALEHGLDPTDFWFPDVALGHPVFHHYQHLPYLVVAVIARVLGLDVTTVFRWATYLLVLLLPLSVAWSVWRLARDPVAGAFAGVCTTLVAAPQGLYGGLDLSNFGWSGSGLVTQLWAVVLIGPVWVGVHRAITVGRGIALAGLGIALTVVTHVFFGYVAAVAAVVFSVVGAPSALGTRLKRLVMVGIVGFAGSAYFVVPQLLDAEAMNRSALELSWKYDSQPASYTFSHLANGQLFDFDGAGWYRRSIAEGGVPAGAARLPVITLLLAVGLVVALVRSVRRKAVSPLLVLFVAWLALFLGRATWGGVVDLLPFSRSLHFHRFLAPVHWAGVALAGVGLAFLWRRVADRAPRVWGPVAAIVITGSLLAVGALERYGGATDSRESPLTAESRSSFGALDFRRHFLRDTQEALRERSDPIAKLIYTARTEQPGRGYAGEISGWGKSYKIGAVHVYDLLNVGRMPAVGFLYHAMSLNADVLWLFDEKRYAHHDLFNVRWRFAPTKKFEQDALPFVRPREVQGIHSLSRVPTTGYFGLVESAGAFAGKRDEWYPAMSHWMRSKHMESRKFPVLFVDRDPIDAFGEPKPLPRLPDLLGAPSTEKPKFLGGVPGESIGPGRFEAQLNIEEPCLLMLKQTFHPGWHVTVDGVEVEPVMVAPAFIAVPVQPGAKRAEFVYRAPAWRLPFALAGLLFALAAIAFEWWRGRGRA